MVASGGGIYASRFNQEDLRASSAGNRDTLWIPYGSWLLSLGPRVAGQQPALIAVAAEQVLAALAVKAGEGASLGENFPGLKVIFPAQVDPNLLARQKLER